jgi:tetratricopeptide (TPR) repeat protein
LNTLPSPPRATSADLPRLIDRLARTSLLAVDPDEHTVFVHRWTASELERRSDDQDHREQLRDAHQRAAEYWRWHCDTWPQDSQAEVHDLLEARHHLLACGDIEQAGTLTEHICSQLDTWGAWDHETTLIHDTLPRLAPDSPRRPVWIHQLGMLAQAWGDYEQAERRYQQSLQINERLGNQSGMATSWSNLGDLAAQGQRYAEAAVWHIRALLVRLSLQVPQATYDVHALTALREQMGNGAFVEAASAVLDDGQLAQVQVVLDSAQNSDQGESDTE